MIDHNEHNITDKHQTLLYAEEIADTIAKIAKEKDLDWEQAKEVVKIGVQNNFTEVVFKGLGNLTDTLNSTKNANAEELGKIAQQLGNISESIDRLTDPCRVRAQ